MSGVIPAKVERCKQSPTFLGLANAFSGGLFLAIALIHILPEVVNEYNEWAEGEHEHPVTVNGEYVPVGHGGEE